MALQLLQNYNSHHAWTGWDDGSSNLATAAEPHRLCKTAVPRQECCTTCGPPAADAPITVLAADPPATVSAADPPITVSAMPQMALKMTSSMNRVKTVLPVILRN